MVLYHKTHPCRHVEIEFLFELPELSFHMRAQILFETLVHFQGYLLHHIDSDQQSNNMEDKDENQVISGHPALHKQEKLLPGSFQLSPDSHNTDGGLPLTFYRIWSATLINNQDTIFSNKFPAVTADPI